VAPVPFLHCLLVCFCVTAYVLINDNGKSNQKKKFITKTVFCLFFLLLPYLSASQPVTLPCTIVHLYAHSHFWFSFHIYAWLPSITFSLTRSKSCSCFPLALVHTSLTFFLFPQCFHTLSPFKPFVLHFFFVLHFTLDLCHTCSIFSVLSLNSWGYICSAA